MVIMHPHPSPLPSRERGNWVESMSILGDVYYGRSPAYVHAGRYLREGTSLNSGLGGLCKDFLIKILSEGSGSKAGS